MLVGVFNRLHADNVCVYGVVDTLPKRYTSRICEGHEDLSSYKVVLESLEGPLTAHAWRGVIRLLDIQLD